MKSFIKILSIILLTLFVVFSLMKEYLERDLNSKSESFQDLPSDNVSSNAKNTYTKPLFIQDTKIYIPIIDGMTECLSDTIVKEMVDATTYPGVSSLAFYLNDNDYDSLKYKTNITGDFFNIQVTDYFKKVKATKNDIKKLSLYYENNYLKMNWSDIKSELKDLLPSMSFDKPVMVESYWNAKDSRTMVLLMKLNGNEGEYIKIAISNWLIINKKFLILNYSTEYKNINSFAQAKAKNDYMLYKLFEVNQ